jgi:hypothetical protein
VLRESSKNCQSHRSKDLLRSGLQPGKCGNETQEELEPPPTSDPGTQEDSQAAALSLDLLCDAEPSKRWWTNIYRETQVTFCVDAVVRSSNPEAAVLPAQSLSTALRRIRNICERSVIEKNSWPCLESNSATAGLSQLPSSLFLFNP